LLIPRIYRSRTIPDIVGVVLWKRFDVTVEHGACYDDGVFVALHLRDEIT